MFEEHLFEKGKVMSTQLSFNLEELAVKRVVGLGDYQLAQQPRVKSKRPHLQLVDATYIERARAKTRHPAGSKLPCPPAVGRENRAEGAAAAFDSLPQWARRARRSVKVEPTLAAVPPAAKGENQDSAQRSAPPKKAHSQPLGSPDQPETIPGVSRTTSSSWLSDRRYRHGMVLGCSS